MRMLLTGLAMVMLIAAAGAAAGCSSEKTATGTLELRANGEDFVRQGFVSRDGWSINFDHVYVNLSEVTAYQTDPPYDPDAGSELDSAMKATLPGSYTVDLAEGGEGAAPMLVDTIDEAAVGHYNAVSFELTRAASGPAAGYSLVLEGRAEKGGGVVDFRIGVDREYRYECGEYIGDERKGIVDEDGAADLEMTFHLDHIFGDADAPVDNHLNVGAVGFDPFARVAEGGALDAGLEELRSDLSAEDYGMLEDALLSLGHVGEGHCHCD
jgi:hypothetical protein